MRQRHIAHEALKRANSIEDALATMLVALAGGGGNVKLRVTSVLGLMKHFKEDSPERQTYACLCLIKCRMERGLKTALATYESFAHALPDRLPDELAAYRDAIVEGARQSLASILTDFLEAPASQPRIQGAIDTIKRKLTNYERQFAGTEQVPMADLQAKAMLKADELKKANTSAKLKRTHEDTVSRTTDNMPPTRQYRQPDQASHRLEQPSAPDGINKPSLLLPPIAVQQRGLEVAPTRPTMPHFAPPLRYLGAIPVTHSGSNAIAQPVPLTVAPRQGRWQPLDCLARLHNLASAGHLKVSRDVTDAIGALAACADRHGLTNVLRNTTEQALAQSLALVRQFSEAVAGELALDIALCAMENGLGMTDELVSALAGALPFLKRLPDDVRFTFALAHQAAQLPPLLAAAMERCFNALMHAPGH